MKKIFLSLLFLFVITSCGQEKTPELSNREITKVISEMTEVMIHDVTNPPLAARFFTYACLAGYEVVSQNDKSCRNMHGILNDYPLIEKPQGASGFSTHLSAVLAMLKTAQKMQPSGKRLEKLEKQVLDSCRTAGFSDDVIERSTQYALEISKQILKYAKADKYNRISNYPRYTPSGKPGTWYPTPPGYFAPVEPYFKTVRPFTLDSSSQFKPVPPVVYSTDKKSAFYQLLEQNYKEDGTKLPDDHRQIAAFWDCNPFALENNGHMMVGLKKISPGAHWLGITGIACAKANKSFAESLKIYTAVAIGLTDGFICCWDEKYRSDRVRPETAIRKLIDQSWKPFLQTPPFPEYLSGHSTISAVSEVILTNYFGNNFAYTDTVEERYGLKARSFSSFREAAIEAGISRFYGGIHFMDAIDNGRDQGLKVGKWVVEKIN
ncbi:vanadium-dependent haloperoxidase [Larkinella rosea]|uniref:Phosphatase PAP2 family protein n=1 Tax=Larkinella rosea TaxID=2025312 RepID=A0A3P1BUX7_9BACT|nr:vanadium-dependent haloperoxidase [Larkinella rosea]RRB04709.1 phosphatase PAP2 family protein [Larkinella rosea]